MKRLTQLAARLLSILSLCVVAKAATTKTNAVLIQKHGAPSSGMDCVQTLHFNDGITAGSFRLTYGIETTAPVKWVSNSHTLTLRVQGALRALRSIGLDGVEVNDEDMEAGGHGDMTVTFDGPKTRKLAVPALEVNVADSVGAPNTIAVTVNVPGVTADGRGITGALFYQDIDTADLYQASGTGADFAWSLVSCTGP